MNYSSKELAQLCRHFRPKYEVQYKPCQDRQLCPNGIRAQNSSSYAPWIFILFINKIVFMNQVEITKLINTFSFSQILFYLHYKPMQKNDLNDLSPIREKKEVNSSHNTLEQSKKHIHICCPLTKAENYECSICNRLRNVCPRSSYNNYRHQASSLFSVQQISNYNQRDAQKFKADRLRTHSLHQSIRNPQNSMQVIQKQSSPQVWQKHIHTQVKIPQTQQIIYYPVIHNVIKNKSFQKFERSAQSTPMRRSNRRIVMDVNEKILTPNEFRQLIDSYRLQ